VADEQGRADAPTEAPHGTVTFLCTDLEQKSLLLILDNASTWSAAWRRSCRRPWRTPHGSRCSRRVVRGSGCAASAVFALVLDVMEQVIAELEARS
jgi:hypothetical protein